MKNLISNLSEKFIQKQNRPDVIGYCLNTRRLTIETNLSTMTICNEKQMVVS